MTWLCSDGVAVALTALFSLSPVGPLTGWRGWLVDQAPDWALLPGSLGYLMGGDSNKPGAP